MRRFWVGTLAVFFVVVVLSGALTYPAWWMVDQWVPDRYHFQRVFNRVLMISTFAMLVPLARYWGVTWRDLGVGWGAGRGGTLVRWFGLGVGMIALLALWYGGWGYREWRWEWTLSRAVGHLASGVAVGVAEEVIFRGFFFLAVCRVLVPRGGWAVGLAGSAVFASVHFFIDVRDRSGVPDWSSGWELWAQWAGLFLSPTQFLTRWLGLFLAGLVLCALVARHGHVWGAVALHAGWVFALKSVHRLSRGSGEPSLWFAPDLLSGLWASLLLAVILGVLLRGNPGLRVRADGAPRNAGDG